MKEILKQLNDLQAKYDFSDEQLVSKIGISQDELDALQKNKPIDPIKLQIVTRFIEKLEQNIYPTKLLEKMETLLQLTFDEQTISVIGAVSGAGKTLASERFAIENPFAIYLYVPEIISVRYLLTTLCIKLGLPSMGLSIPQMFEQISNNMLQEKRLLIFDESDRLNRKMFEILRDIWHDGKGNLGIAFVGDENLMNKIKRPSDLRENLIRLMRRVKYTEILQPLHADDVKMVFKQHFGKHKITEKMIEQVFAKYGKLGGLGSILNLADKVLKLSNRSGDQPNNEMCEEAMKRLKL